MIDIIRDEFINLEALHFNITNCYIMGVITTSDIDRFKEALDGFRAILYDFEPDEETLLEIAKMKSVVQHYNTEILEDEEVLRVAYSNSN